MDSWAVIIGLIFVIGAVALIAARQPSRATDITLDPQPGVRTQPDQQPPAPTPRLDAKKAIAPKPPATRPAAEPQTVHAPANHTPVALSASATPAAPSERVLDSTPTASAAHPAPASAVENVASVTITGCLEHDEETFWLRDASGVDTPTSRSWKSGFLKKRPSRIEIVDATNALRLPSYVGQRVTASGTLVNREMKTRSLYRVSSSCS